MDGVDSKKLTQAVNAIAKSIEKQTVVMQNLVKSMENLQDQHSTHLITHGSTGERPLCRPAPAFVLPGMNYTVLEAEVTCIKCARAMQ